MLPPGGKGSDPRRKPSKLYFKKGCHIKAARMEIAKKRKSQPYSISVINKIEYLVINHKIWELDLQNTWLDVFVDKFPNLFEYKIEVIRIGHSPKPNYYFEMKENQLVRIGYDFNRNLKCVEFIVSRRSSAVACKF